MKTDQPGGGRPVPSANAPIPEVAAPRYVIITPARDEERNLPGTIASIAGQTIRPSQWIIVDDGSTDRTGRLADEASQRHPWITVLHRPDRGRRKAGGGVVESFYAGLERLAVPNWEFLVKLDGDLSFGADYFGRCFEGFRTDPKLGVGGGTICVQKEGVLVKESNDPRFHVRGATKIYRRECWEAIGGLIEAPGWDTLDEVKANMLGWHSYTFPDLPVTHHRSTGEADGTWRNWFKNGMANYIVGYHPLFMLGKCASRSVKRPYGIAALGLLSGFVAGYLRHVPQIPDKDLIRYLRREQFNRMLLRKSLWNY